MISFAEQFSVSGYNSRFPCVMRPDGPAPNGLEWEWRMVDFGADPRDDLYNWVAVPTTGCVQLPLHNPLEAMCNYKDTHSTERLPASTAKPAIEGLMCVRELGDRSRIGA